MGLQLGIEDVGCAGGKKHTIHVTRLTQLYNILWLYCYRLLVSA